MPSIDVRIESSRTLSEKDVFAALFRKFTPGSLAVTELPTSPGAPVTELPTPAKPSGAEATCETCEFYTLEGDDERDCSHPTMPVVLFPPPDFGCTLYEKATP